jgi:hypothetical protein
MRARVAAASVLAVGSTVLAVGPSTATAAAKLEQCRADRLDARFDGRRDGLTSIDRTFRLRNNGKKPCFLLDRPDAGAVFLVENSHSHRGEEVTVERSSGRPVRLVLQPGTSASSTLTYDNCLPFSRDARTYLALRLGGSGPSRDLAISPQAEPLSLDGGVLRQCNPRVSLIRVD